MKPPWLRIRPPSGKYAEVKAVLAGSSLHTVCQSARCPNQGECWGSGTATFLLLGNVCTRGCRFCATPKASAGLPIDAGEGARIAEAARRMGLRYVVLTSVCRDDLPDGGAAHFAACIRALKEKGFLVEALVPDFRGNDACLRAVLAARPDILAHNIEVVERLTPLARDRRASYRQSLAVLANAKKAGFTTKSSLMLGLGEREEEVLRAMDDLRAVGCDILTLGQYLQPTPAHLPVAEFIAPEAFARLKAIALEKGFRFVASGPFIRSSYRAGELFAEMTACR
ncbi:MAG: lipoyl synthase [Candidatus Micrarchaeia archaeon]